MALLIPLSTLEAITIPRKIGFAKHTGHASATMLMAGAMYVEKNSRPVLAQWPTVPQKEEELKPRLVPVADGPPEGRSLLPRLSLGLDPGLFGPPGLDLGLPLPFAGL